MKQKQKSHNISQNKKPEVMAFGSDMPVIPRYVERRGRRFVQYGDRNNFPEYLWDLYLRSNVLQAICNGTADYVSGGGISLDPSLEKFASHQNKKGETIEEVIRKVCIDYLIFGGFAIEPEFDRKGNLINIYWIDFKSVRVDEDCTRAFIKKDWSVSAQPLEYDIYDGTNREGAPIFYYKGHISRGVYPVPMYVGSMAAIETGASIQNFHLRNIKNNFLSGVVVNFVNGVPTEEEQRKIQRSMKESFSGDDNAGSLFLNFCDNKDQAVVISKLADDNFDKKFEQLEKSTTKNIFISFRATPALFGVNPEGNGFSKTEFLEAYELYYKTMVRPIQKDLERAFDKCFGIDGSVRFIPFNLESYE